MVCEARNCPFELLEIAIYSVYQGAIPANDGVEAGSVELTDLVRVSNSFCRRYFYLLKCPHYRPNRSADPADPGRR